MKLVTTDTLDYVESAKSFDIVASPNGLVYDPETGAMEQDTIQVEVWRVDPDTEPGRTRVVCLNTYGLTLSATAGGANVDTSAEEKEATVTYEDYDGEMLTFAELVEEFNEVLDVEIDASKGVYKYLEDYFNYAYTEWNDNNSALFRADTYPEVYNYRGDDRTYFAVSYNAMQSWLMAMCLSELVPTADTYNDNTGEWSKTNKQTELFAKAYDLAGGASVPLYGSFDIHADPMIARLAASAVYAIVRGRYEFAEINTYRDQLGGDYIRASKWEELGFEHTRVPATGDPKRGYQVTRIGYTVNTGLFIPNAPGPRVANSVCDSLPHPKDGHPELVQLFNPVTGNYLVDEAADQNAVDNYDMNSQTPLSKWKSYSLEKQQRLIQVGVTPSASLVYMLGPEIPVELVLDPSTGDLPKDQWWEYRRFVFRRASKNNGLTLKGPFSSLSDKINYFYLDQDFNSQEQYDPYKSEVMRFIDTVIKVGDEFRKPTYDPNYGRRRPGSEDSLNPQRSRGEEAGKDKGSDEDMIFNSSLVILAAETRLMVNKATISATENGFSQDAPTSYPSGHASQSWALALMLGQMKSYGSDTSSIIEYIRGAYEFSVNRVLGRFHWNSDIIYGRLFGTMALPILNAMDGLQPGYRVTRDAVINGQGGGSGSASVEYNSGGGSIGSITIIVNNNTSGTISINGRFGFFLKNGSAIAQTSMPEEPSLARDIPAGQSSGQMVYPLSQDDLQKVGLPFIEDAFDLGTNVVVYDGSGNSVNLRVNAFSTSQTFTDGGTYTLNIGGNSPSTVSGGGSGAGTTIAFSLKNNSGRSIVIQPSLRFVLKHNGVTARTEKLVLRQGVDSIAIANGETESFYGIAVDQVSAELLECRFAGADELDGYPGNAMIYDTDGVAETYKMPMFPTSDRFAYGATYSIVLGGGSPTPTPNPTPPSGGNPVITIGVRIYNAHGSAVTLDGDLKLTLGNPDHNGNYLGWYGAYTGTPHLRFSPGEVTLAAGETRTFYGVTWRDEETGCGFGGKSPADTAELAVSGRPRNVLLYVGGNSEVYLCDNMSPDIELQEGGVYDITIR